MFPLVILAALVGGTLAGCNQYDQPQTLDATTGPDGNPPPPSRNLSSPDASLRSDAGTVDVNSSDRYTSAPRPQQELRAVREGIQTVSNMCDWYNTDFEKDICRTGFGLLDLWVTQENVRRR
ncbi:MAG: hypothetical protein U1F66_06410 [bacterium]